MPINVLDLIISHRILLHIYNQHVCQSGQVEANSQEIFGADKGATSTSQSGRQISAFKTQRISFLFPFYEDQYSIGARNHQSRFILNSKSSLAESGNQHLMHRPREIKIYFQQFHPILDNDSTHRLPIKNNCSDKPLQLPQIIYKN